MKQVKRLISERYGNHKGAKKETLERNKMQYFRLKKKVLISVMVDMNSKTYNKNYLVWNRVKKIRQNNEKSSVTMEWYHTV